MTRASWKQGSQGSRSWDGWQSGLGIWVDEWIAVDMCVMRPPRFWLAAFKVELGTSLYSMQQILCAKK